MAVKNKFFRKPSPSSDINYKFQRLKISKHVDSKALQVVCCSLRCFGCGSPSREVMLRNVAAVSRLAEPTPHQPRLPPSAPLLLTSLPLFSSSLCAAEHRGWFLAEGYWVTCHRERKKNVLIYFDPQLQRQKKSLFLCVFIHGGGGGNYLLHLSRMRRTPLWWRLSSTP